MRFLPLMLVLGASSALADDILHEEFVGLDLKEVIHPGTADPDIVIINVHPGSQAEAAGLAAGDEIWDIDLTNPQDLLIQFPTGENPSPNTIRTTLKTGMDHKCPSFVLRIHRTHSDPTASSEITFAYPGSFSTLLTTSPQHQTWLNNPSGQSEPQSQNSYYEKALQKNREAAQPYGTLKPPVEREAQKNMLAYQQSLASNKRTQWPNQSEPSSALINFIVIVFLSPLIMSAALSTVAALNGEHKTLTFTPSKLPRLPRMPSTRRLYHYIRPFKKFYVMWKIASRPPPPKPKPPPTPQQTKAAQNHLKIAFVYLDKLSSQKLMQEVYEHLKAATKHINDARNLDPAAVYTDPDAKPEFKSDWTCDDLAARALFIEALFDSKHTLTEASWDRALIAIDKALAYRPHVANYHRQKAVILTRLFRREEAYASINKALELDPSDFDIITTKDRMDADPLIGVKPAWKPESGLVFAIAILVGLLGLYLGFTNNTWYLWLLMVAALIWSYADKVMGFRELVEMQARHADLDAGRKGPHDL